MRCTTFFERARRLVRKGCASRKRVPGPMAGMPELRRAGRKATSIRTISRKIRVELVFDHIGKRPRYNERGRRAAGWQGGVGYQSGETGIFTLREGGFDTAA